MTDPVSDVTRLIDDWERNANQKAARFQQMAQRVEGVSITESVADGAVSVTVGHNGLPTDVSMTEQVLRMRPEEIASNVMSAIRKAQSRFPEQLAEILADTVGEDDPASRHILARAEESFPPLEEPGEQDEERFSFGEDDGDTSAERSSRPQPAAPRRPSEDTDDEDADDDSIFRG